MRIAYIGDLPRSDSPTGPERFASELFEEMKKYEDVWFYQYICSDTPCPWTKKLFGKLEVDQEKRIIRGGIFSILFNFMRNKWDILHLVTYLRSAISFLLISKIKKVRTVYSLHGVIAYEDQIKSNLRRSYILKNRIFEKLISLVTDTIAAVSSSVGKIFSGIFPGVNGKITIIPNGIRTLNNKTTIISSGGPLRIITFTSSIKRYHFLFVLIQFVIANPKDYFLTILGTTEAKIPPANNILFKNKLNHKEWLEELSNHDIYINVGQYEPFSIAALEALSCGLCVFMNKEIGLTEFLIEDKEYFNYSLDDAESLFSKLRVLYNNRYLLSQSSLSAINASKRFSIEKECSDYRLFYRNLMVL